jgi:hypothetical protein
VSTSPRLKIKGAQGTPLIDIELERLQAAFQSGFQG